MPIALSPSCAADAALVSLVAFLTAGDAWLGPNFALTCDDRGAGRGVVAVDAVPAGTAVARVPLSLLMTNEALLEEDEGLRAVAKGLSSTNLAALGLLRQRDPERAWASYANALPRAVGTTLEWSEQELAELQASDLLTHTRTRLDAIRRGHARVSAALASATPPSHDEFAWALSIVWSRAHTVRVGGKRGGALTPLLDLFNSDFTAPSADAATLDDDGLVVRTARDLAAGDEVTVPYGDVSAISNARALLDYGCCSPGENRHDDVAVPLTAEGCGGADTRAALDALDLLTSSRSPPARLGGLGASAGGTADLPAELAAYGRVCAMDADGIGALLTDARSDDVAAQLALRERLGAPLDASADGAAAAAVARLLRGRLAEDATSAEHDAGLLSNPGRAARERFLCALRVRLAEKRILRAWAERLEPDHDLSGAEADAPPLRGVAHEL